MTFKALQNLHPSRRSIRSWLRPASRLKRLFRQWRQAQAHQELASSSEPLVDFRCNICGSSNRVPFKALQREEPSCARCASTVRDRAMVYHLTSALLGRGVELPDLAPRRDLIGIGLSDSITYAIPLAEKFAYTNTYFDAEPRLDIANIGPELDVRYDFIVASDVFEHVAPPVARAFFNAKRLLKPGGVMIFSVPFMLTADTIEHFPELHDYRLIKSPDGWQLENRTVDGRVQTFTDLVFHGGPGATLEMREFSLESLKREFAAAGFSRMRVADEVVLAHGIYWPEPWSIPMVAYA